VGRYKKGEAENRMSAEGYLLHLDHKLGMSDGTLSRLCKEAFNSAGGFSERKECRVTYKGIAVKYVKQGSGRFVESPRQVFLIEGGLTKEGRKVLAQVYLTNPPMQNANDQTILSNKRIENISNMI
jgi:hypothetical protein